MDHTSKPAACYEGHLGDLLVKAEQTVLKELFNRMFGLHLVWIGYNALLPVLESSLVQHKLVLGDAVNPHLRVSKLISHPETLSIQPDSVDVVILVHALETSPNPHHVLREAHRILRPEGQLIITGFNPISMLGIWHALKFEQKLLTAHRVIDWCKLFDLDLHKKSYFFYRVPLQHARLMDKTEWLESKLSKVFPGLGGGYCLHFVKRVAKLTPIRPNWKIKQEEVWVSETVQNTAPHQNREQKF